MASTGNEICSVTFKGVQINCVIGNIVECSLAGITVSCSPSFDLAVGVGKAVKRAAGPNFQTDLNVARQTQNDDVVVVDSSGTLKARKVILVALRNRHRHSMHEIFLQIFDKAILANLESIAIPALGTGAFGLSFSDVADYIKRAFQSRPSFGVLKKVQFMDLSANSMNVFSNSIRSLLPSSTSQPINVSSSSSGSASSSAPSSTASSVSTISSTSSASSSASSHASSPISPLSLSSSSSSNFAVPSPPKRAHLMSSTDYFTIVSEHDLKKHKTAMEPSSSNDDSSQLPCSICLCDLISEDSIVSKDSSALVIEEVVMLKLCKHMFHKDCIENCFKVKKQCPNCMKWYSAAIGNQPKNSTMNVRKVAGCVPGHPEARGWHEIAYNIPGGTQTAEHLRPGVNFSGSTRIAYLPDSIEGTITLRLLQLAFEKRLIFTVGDSVTTGQQNVVIWNGIHHKTSMCGGPTRYGFPDDNYFRRVQDELASVGIFKEMLD